MPAGSGLKKEIIEATRQANILQNALKKATTDKGLSFVSLNSELRKAGTTAEHMVTTLAKAGPAFSGTFNTALTALATADRRVIGISEKIKEMQRVMTQSIKFTAAQEIQRAFMSVISSSIGWVKDLNSAITEISVVTGKTGADLDKVFQTAVSGSKQLRVAVDEYAKGALIFYQQGLSDEEVNRRTQITIKSAKAAGQSVQEMSSQLTSIWNNYRMIGEEQERAAAVGAALAAKTAVDFKDIAEAMQTAAAPAAQMGVEYNQLAAIIATVGDVSQQSASTIGNAYKTIFSRFQQLRSEGTDGEVTLSSVSSQLKGLGINVLDQAGNLRELGTVINEVGTNWDKWTQTQQTAIAQIVGGTRQYGQFLTLMNNFDKYQKNLKIANAEDGSELEGQYGRALESIKSKAENAAEAWKRAFGGVLDEDLIKDFYETIEKAGNAVDGIFAAFGDWKGVLTIIAALMAKQIAPAAINMVKNVGNVVTNLTPEKRVKNRAKEANSTRGAAIDVAINSSTNRMKNNPDVVNALNEIKDQTKNSNKNQLKNLKDQLIATNQLTKAEQRQLQINFQKAEIQEKIGTMATKIEQIESIGTAAAKQKAEMLREQLKAYSDQLLALTDQADKLRKTNEDRRAVLEGQNQAALEENDNYKSADTLQEEENLARLRAQLQGIYDLQADYADQGNFDMFESLGEQAAEISGQIDEVTNRVQELNKQDINNFKSNLNVVEKGLLEISDIINDAMVEALANIENGEPGKEPAKVIIDSLKESLKESSGPVKDALEEIMNLDGSTLDLSELQRELQVALSKVIAEAGDTEDAEVLQQRLQEIMNQVQTGSDLEGQGSGILTSINTQLEDFTLGVDAAVTGAVNLAAAFAMVTTGASAMSKALEEGDLLAFASGLGIAATGVIQFVSAIPAAKAGFTALGTSLSKMGGSIAGVIPGLSGLSAQIAAGEASLGAMAAAAGVAVIAIAAVVAVVAALVFAWNEYNNAKPENKLKRAEEAAQELTKAEEDAVAAAKELRDTFDDYKSAEEALENCKRGTEEWEQALRKVNDAAMAVVDSLPDDINIADAYSRGEDGRIRLNDDVIKQGQKSLDEQSQLASYTASSAKVQASMARNDLDASNLAKIISQGQSHYDSSSDAEVVDQSAKQITKLLTESAESFKDLSTNNLDEFKKVLAGAGIDIEHLTDTEIQNFAQGLIDLGNSTEAAREKMELAAKMAVDEKLDGKNYDNDVKDLTGERVAAATKDLTDKYLGALTNGEEGSLEWEDKYGNIKKQDTEIDEELLADYNELTGKNLVSSGNGVQGTDTNRIFEFIDEQNNVITKSAKQMAEEMAAAAALLDVEGAAADIAKDFNILNGIINKAGQEGASEEDAARGTQAEAIKNILVDKNMNNLTDAELESMAGLSNEQIVDMVKEMFNFDDAQLAEWVEGYGYKSVDAFVQGVKDGTESSISASEHAADKLTSSTKEIFNSIADDGNLTVSAKENLAKSLVQIFDNFDEEAVQGFANVVDKMGGDADVFLQNIDNIDWDTQSPDILREKLSEMGIEAKNLSDDELQTLIKTLQTVGSASVSSAQAYNKKLGDAANGVDGNNSIISDEDYKALEQAGINVREYFEDMADGTHQLTMDADEFKQMVNSLQIGKLQEAKDNAEQKYEDLEWVKGYAENIDNGKGSTFTQARVLQATGDVSNSQMEGWEDRGWDDAGVAEEVRQAYADAGMSAEKIEQLMTEAASEAARAQEAMDNAEFAFEVESAGLDLEETTRYANRLKNAMLEGKNASKMSEQEMRLYKKAAQDAAIANQRLDRGLGNLKKNLKDYKKALADSNEGTAEWSEAMTSLKEDLADIVGFDDSDLFSDEFAKTALDGEDLQKALEGDIEAVKRLQAAAAEDMMVNLQFNNELSKTEFTSVMTQWNYLKDALKDGVDAPGVNQEKLVKSFNEMIKNGHMTKDQIEAALAGLHVSANIKTTYTKQTEKIPIQTTETWWEDNPGGATEVPIYDPEDGSVVGHYTKPAQRKMTKTYTARYEDAETQVPSYEIEGTTGEGQSTQVFVDAPPPAPSTGGTSFSDNPSTGGGGSKGGSKKSNFKKKDAHKKSDPLEERYANIKSSIDKTSRSIEKLSDAMDDAWGAKKYKNLLAINQQLGVQAKKNQILLKEARQYLALDQSNLQKVLSDNGLGQALFNSDGFLSNKENIYAALNQLREPLEQAVQTAIDAYNAAGEGAAEEVLEGLEKQQEIAEKALSDFEENIQSKVLEQIDKVNDSAEEAHKAMKELIDSIREIMSNWVETETFKLDLRMEINDQDIRTAEHLLEVWGDIGTKMGMTADKYKEIAGSNIDTIEGALKNAQTMQDMIEGLKRGDNDAANWLKDTHGEEAYNKWLNGNGGVPDVVMEQLAAAVDQMQDARDAGQEALRNMMQEWTKALGMMMEDFDKLAEKLEHNQETLDMWSNVLDGMGMSQTVDGATAMAKAAKASYDTTLKQSHVLKEQALTAKTASTAANKALNDFKDAHGGAMFDFANLTENEQIQYQEFLSWVEESDAALAEAESAFKSKISELVDKMGEILEKELTRLRAEFFSKIDGAFYDWDSMENIYGMMEDQEDLFLSDLDKHYNLDKLTGEINDYIEDSVDLSNMEDYEALLEEINGLLESGQKINQTDLDSLIAKFNIMKEMDAYEEAKNSKNIMRLQRDASGNYAYVYSSDASASDAEDQTQKLKDALYEYEKLQQDAADAMEDAWLATFAKIGKLEEDRAKAEAENNEKTLANIDEQLRIENENLDYYASEIEKRYGNIEEFLKKYRDNDKTNFDWLQNHKEVSFNQSNLNYLMGTEDTFDKMTGFHEHFKEYMVTDFQVKIDEVRTELVNKTLVDIETVGEGLDFMEGDYTDLADLVEDKSNDIMTSNKEVADSATNLRNTSTAAIDAMTKNIVSNSNIMVRELNRVVQEINKAIQALQAYRRAQQEEMENTPNNTFTSDTNEEGNDKPVDLPSPIPPQQPSDPSDSVGSGGTSYVGERVRVKTDVTHTPSGAKWRDFVNNGKTTYKVLQIGSGKRQGQVLIGWPNYKGGDTDDGVLGRDKGITGWLYQTDLQGYATGGLVRDEQIIKAAEKGPELVLNAKDTENILAAVALMRQTVAAQFGSINGSLLGATSGISSAAQAFSTSSQVVDQNVKIEASFPGVSVAQEIEDALNSLITQAAQYNIKK